MKSLWNNKIAQQYVSQYKKKNIEKDLALRIYTTHLLGKNPKYFSNKCFGFVKIYEVI